MTTLQVIHHLITNLHLESIYLINPTPITVSKAIEYLSSGKYEPVTPDGWKIAEEHSTNAVTILYS